jgi:hypothetical protein
LRQEEGGEDSRRIIRSKVMESRLKSGQNDEENNEDIKEGVRNTEARVDKRYEKLT